jgi:hypothetical protein
VCDLDVSLLIILIVPSLLLLLALVFENNDYGVRKQSLWCSRVTVMVLESNAYLMVLESNAYDVRE